MNNFIRPFVRLARSEGDQRGSCRMNPHRTSFRRCCRISIIHCNFSRIPLKRNWTEMLLRTVSQTNSARPSGGRLISSTALASSFGTLRGKG